jgi:hypothetical protein
MNNAKSQQLVLCAVAAAFLGAGYLITRDKIPSIAIEPLSVSGSGYDPFIHWRVQEGPGWYHHPHPAGVAQNTLPEIIQNQDRGLAVEMVEVDHAATAQ